MKLVEKYDIALSQIFGAEKVDLIADAGTEEEIRNVSMQLEAENFEEQVKWGKYHKLNTIRRKNEQRKNK